MENLLPSQQHSPLVYLCLVQAPQGALRPPWQGFDSGCPGRWILVLTEKGSSQQRPSTSGWCSWREGPGTCRVPCCLPPPAPAPAKHSQCFRATGLPEAEVQACTHQDIQLWPRQVSPGQRPRPWTLVLGPLKTRPLGLLRGHEVLLGQAQRLRQPSLTGSLSSRRWWRWLE